MHFTMTEHMVRAVHESSDGQGRLRESLSSPDQLCSCGSSRDYGVFTQKRGGMAAPVVWPCRREVHRQRSNLTGTCKFYSSASSDQVASRGQSHNGIQSESPLQGSNGVPQAEPMNEKLDSSGGAVPSRRMHRWRSLPDRLGSPCRRQRALLTANFGKDFRMGGSLTSQSIWNFWQYVRGVETMDGLASESDASEPGDYNAQSKAVQNDRLAEDKGGGRVGKKINRSGVHHNKVRSRSEDGQPFSGFPLHEPCQRSRKKSRGRNHLPRASQQFEEIVHPATTKKSHSQQTAADRAPSDSLGRGDRDQVNDTDDTCSVRPSCLSAMSDDAPLLAERGNTAAGNVERNADAQESTAIDRRPVEEDLGEFSEIVQFLRMRQGKLQRRLSAARQLQAGKPTIDLSCLDTNVRKISCFIKKIRTFQGFGPVSGKNVSSLEAEIKRYNLSKYVSEVSDAVSSARLNKAAEVSLMANLCLKIAQRYPDFPLTLCKSLRKNAAARPPSDRTPQQFRMEARLIAELILTNVFSTKPEALKMAKSLLFWLLETNLDQDAETGQFRFCAVLLTLCKAYGDELADLMSYSMQKRLVLSESEQEKLLPILEARSLTSELWDKSYLRRSSNLFTDEDASKLRNLLSNYYVKLLQKMKQLTSELKSVQLTNALALQNKGEVNVDQQKMEEDLTAQLSRLRENALGLNDMLAEEPIVFEFCSQESKEAILSDLATSDSRGADELPEEDMFIWENEEIRAFYKELPDLTSVVPRFALKGAGCDSAETRHRQDEELGKERICVEEIEKELEQTTVNTEENEEGGQPLDNPPEDSEDPGAKCLSAAAETQQLATAAHGDDSSSLSAIAMDAFLDRLQSLTNIQLVDKAAHEFCVCLNTKQNRHRLAQFMCRLQRTRGDLLPFYARLAASLSTVVPEIGDELSIGLKNQFKFHLRKKDQTNLDYKLKTMRFIGELAKFELISKHDTLQCIKLLLADFTHHNIDMCCCLLENCGRFLYRNPSSNKRTQAYLEIIMRKKKAYITNERYKTLIDNAFYYCNPQQPAIVQEPRPHIHQYLLFLLSRQLGKITVNQIVESLRKLDWTDEAFYNFAMECFASPHIVRFNSIVSLADVLSGVAIFVPRFVVEVVDLVTELISTNLEHVRSADCQRLICLARYIGELYNFAVIDGVTLIKTLHFIISPDQQQQVEADPPDSLIRIRMVSSALYACGPYTDDGDDFDSLVHFLFCFQCYYWAKRTAPFWMTACFPYDVTQSVVDAIYRVDPDFALATSLPEAIEQMNARYPSLPLDTDRPAKGGSPDSNGLNAVSNRPTSGIAVVTTDGDDEGSIENNGDDETIKLFNDHLAEQYMNRCHEDINVPMIGNSFALCLPKKLGQSDVAAKVVVANGVEASGKKSQNADCMTFTLISKQNNKPRYHHIDVPSSSPFVMRLLAEKEADQAEREELKRLTLNISEMQQIEEQEDNFNFGSSPLNKMATPTATSFAAAYPIHLMSVPASNELGEEYQLDNGQKHSASNRVVLRPIDKWNIQH